MSTSIFSLFSKPTYQTEVQRNTHLVNNFGEIQTEPPQRMCRGRKPGSTYKTKPKNHKKQQNQRRRGMGIAMLEQVIAEEEYVKKILGGDTSSVANPNKSTRLPVVPDPFVMLQGFPNYGGGPTMKTTSSSLGGGCAGRSGFYNGGIGSDPRIMFDPVYSPSGFGESYGHDLSSIPNTNVSNVCDASFFKKKCFDGNDNGLIPPPPVNGYDHHLLQVPDQRGQCVFHDHGITNHMGSVEEFGSVNPRNGTGSVKEYEFFPGKCDDFSGKDGETVSSVATSVGDCSPDTSNIDLSLKL